MASKITPIPIRLGDERLAKVMAYATDRGISRHAAMLALIDKGLSANTLPVADPLPAGKPTSRRNPETLAAAQAKADAIAPTVRAGDLVPLAGTFERAPMQKAPGKRRWRV